MVQTYHKGMPKRVDHDARRRQITDAVCRITLRGGLGAATFRQVASEASMSVRNVQYYFGNKKQLLDITQQHVGERSIARLTRWIKATDGSPRAILGAFLKSFVPSDEESRVAMLMYIALAAEHAVAEPIAAAGATRQTETQMMLSMTAEQITRGAAHDIDAEVEAASITAMMPGLGNFVLDGTMTAAEVFRVIDHQLDRIFAVVPAKEQR